LKVGGVNTVGKMDNRRLGIKVGKRDGKGRQEEEEEEEGGREEEASNRC
jgi:hypothetical protein